MTPRTLGSDDDTVRGSVKRMISWTCVMGSAYSSSPREKTTSWRERVSSGMRTPSWCWAAGPEAGWLTPRFRHGSAVVGGQRELADEVAQLGGGGGQGLGRCGDLLGRGRGLFGAGGDLLRRGGGLLGHRGDRGDLVADL